MATVVISLQMNLGTPVIVGGRTALELQGYSHYLPRATKEVYLYGPTPLPGWVNRLSLDVQFIFHSSSKLFQSEIATLASLSKPRPQQRGAAQSGYRCAAVGTMGMAADAIDAGARRAGIARRIAGT